METKTTEICIVGAGVSGLIAAKTLEQADYTPVIVEQSKTIGGRVQTDIEDTIFFDRGFQVLLTAYPQAKKHLDYKALQLQYFKPGALIFSQGKRQRIGDPLRDISALWPTVWATVGTFQDKLKIFNLSRQLKKKTIASIFLEPEMTTAAYLKHYGFSDTIIAHFFKPFFTGIFLEEELRTSSRMFEFVFKMFAEGSAAIPKAGIGAIPDQLKSGLRKTQFHMGKKVAEVKDTELVFQDGTAITAEHIITTSPLDVSAIAWKSCDNLYFEVQEQQFPTGIIGLIAAKEALTNNLHYLFDAQTGGKKVLSVTVVKEHGLNGETLAQKVSDELRSFCEISTVQLLKHYRIQRALPDIKDLKMNRSVSEYSSKQGLYTAGDYLLNSSLNAAMRSGEATAEALFTTIKG
ncbi:MAG: FAD-dependent oxidoreductase [Bacteroidota bacterium]